MPQKGTRVLVTGSSQGIGLGIAEALAEAGARVVITGRSPQRLEGTVEEFGRRGLELNAVVGDLTSRAGCRAVVEEAADLLGGLEVLCANAGVYPEERLEDISEASVALMMQTNVGGTIFTVQAAIPYLAASGRGRIVITSSITGPITGYPGLSVYAATKAAQLGFMRTAALELANRGITVNAVSPGSIQTGGLDGLGPDAIAAMRRAIPVGRLGLPADIGAAVLFLASSQASFITGQELIVDGGQTLPELPELV